MLEGIALELVAAAAAGGAALGWGASTLAERRRRRAVAGAAADAGATVATCPHAWKLRSRESTNRREHEIYVCVACNAREIREVGAS